MPSLVNAALFASANLMSAWWFDSSPARGDIVAIRAVALVRRSDERAADNHFAQVGQHRPDRRERGSLDTDTLAPPFVAGEVVDRAAHLRLLVACLEQFKGGQPVERVLQATPAGEDPLPAVAPVAAGLVVQHLERGRAHFVDAVDPSRDLERHAVAKADRHRLRTRERFLVAIQRPAK